MHNEEKVGKLEEEAVKRRERLSSLKKKRKHASSEEDAENKVIFRNYDPETESLKESTLPKIEPSGIDDLIEDHLNDEKKEEDITEVEISNLAPKKITFDLKRGIQNNLDRLEQRTDRAIAELIRQRLKEGKQQDFLIEVNAGMKADQAGYDSDD